MFDFLWCDQFRWANLVSTKKNIKRKSKYVYKHDYIQPTEILMFPDLQR